MNLVITASHRRPTDLHVGHNGILSSANKAVYLGRASVSGTRGQVKYKAMKPNTLSILSPFDGNIPANLNFRHSM